MLANQRLQTLAAFAASNVLLGFDFDGTLAPIVRDPSAARMRASTGRLLTLVADRYPCVVISGRAHRDLRSRVPNVPVAHLFGNHGLEPWATSGSYRALVRGWVRRLGPLLAPYAGIVIEDKTYSVTVHFRHSRRPRQAAAAARRAVRSLRGARYLGGKHAVSAVPFGAPDKGAALEHARQLLACETVMYVGDEHTDEDAFVSSGDNRLLAIRIGARRDSKAAYYLRDQNEIDDLLRALLTCRRRPHEGRRQ